MTKTKQLRRKDLLNLLRYDEKSGEFYWRVSQGTMCAGAVAGNKHQDGYVYIAINRTVYRRTRLIWLYIHGRWPIEHVDHINGNTSDDSLFNLREATRSQNLGNRKLNKNSTSGFKGVSVRGSKFMAYVNKDGRRHYLGLYKTPESAHAAYVAKAIELFGEFARAS